MAKSTWKPNRKGMDELARSPQFARALEDVADRIESGTQERANWKGYQRATHWQQERGTNSNGAYVEAATSYPFAHLDEFGGAQHVSPTRPMQRTVDALGLEVSL